ncbi:uncharacterized protein LOC118407935 [Branchiostoma floridae]|uniref:Uncharacterized protein LOC118407935 n=1 Tax=Branchiostoma floridae TaxID=7739 RepID=A0A9J7HR65_BRAFL|nr:uncharacterized protein LOC118407935 [Branchiostoma floridae]
MTCNSGQEFRYPEACNFVCNRGYKLTHTTSRVRHCQTDATWSGNDAECIAYASCAALKDVGYTTSGSYVIDPDGPDFGAEPFSVYCDFPRGTTVISHDSESRTSVSPRCNPAGCYKRNRVLWPATGADGSCDGPV